MFIFENASNSKNQTRQQNEKFNERDKKNFKRKTYVLNKFEKKMNKNSLRKSLLSTIIFKIDKYIISKILIITIQITIAIIRKNLSSIILFC